MNKLVISEDLRSILIEMKDKCFLASKMLEENITDTKPDFANYISIASDPTKLSYLTSDRLQKLNEEGVDLWKTSSRYLGRPATVIRKIFENISDRDVEIFNDYYRSIMTRIRFDMKVVDGEDIKKYYLHNSYSEQSGSLGVSCMKYDSCQKFLDIYVENPDLVKMLVMLDQEQKIMGRALLWNLEDEKIMDRIYTINDNELPFHFKKWANQNDYSYKYEQKWNNTIMFESNGIKMNKEITFKLKNWDYSYFPYFDTFKFIDLDNGNISNFLPNGWRQIKNLRTISAPDGRTYNPDQFAFDFIENIFQHQGDTVCIKYKDGVYIDDRDRRTHVSNCCYSDVLDMYILKDDAFHDEYIRDYYFKTELDSLNDHERINERKEYVKKRLEEQAKRDQERKKQFTDIFDLDNDFIRSLSSRFETITRPTRTRFFEEIRDNTSQTEADEITNESPIAQTEVSYGSSFFPVDYNTIQTEVSEPSVVQTESPVNQTQTELTIDQMSYRGNLYEQIDYCDNREYEVPSSDETATYETND